MSFVPNQQMSFVPNQQRSFVPTDMPMSYRQPFVKSQHYHPQANQRPLFRCHRCNRVGHKWRKCYAKTHEDGTPLN
jgi:dTDP-4-dehydrorhamnose 3,5-epimerase-like enzyme